MSVSAEVFIQCLMLIAAGLCGFGLGGMTGSDKTSLRAIGWFVAGVLVGILSTAGFYAYNQYQ